MKKIEFKLFGYVVRIEYDKQKEDKAIQKTTEAKRKDMFADYDQYLQFQMYMQMCNHLNNESEKAKLSDEQDADKYYRDYINEFVYKLQKERKQYYKEVLTKFTMFGYTIIILDQKIKEIKCEGVQLTEAKRKDELETPIV